MDSYALKSVSDLPAPFRPTFNFRYFNSLQSESFAECFLSDINMVISAPTGSGKTVLFELCILRLLSRFLSKEERFIHVKGTLKTNYNESSLERSFIDLYLIFSSMTFKSYQPQLLFPARSKFAVTILSWKLVINSDRFISFFSCGSKIYIAPSKALVQEKLRDWNHKLGSWGINCLELTGDSEVYNIRNLQEADVILTTPEKFDAVTRYRIRDGGLSFFSDIGLLLIDEVHLLNDMRGASLEAIVSRIKMLSKNSEMHSSTLARVRLVAVSATIPNIEDLAEWLMAPSQGIKRFGEEMRPVKLTTRVFGYAPAKNDFLFERRLQNYVYDILMQNSRGKSALVFCSTRKGAQGAALRLSQTAMTFGHSNPFIKSREQQERLKDASLSCSDKQMQSCIQFGVGYHNGGLCLKDRNLIEGLFLRGDLQVLCTTNTLAHGINLPAHTVVIKSTQNFNKEKGMYLEYDRSMILQMCGRAGRPPFDDTGMVIIMTRKDTVHLYENLLNGCEMVESQLLSCVTEHLAAEIVQLTVSDITRAIEWMKCSYLYVRMKKNPENYGVKKKIPGESLERHMQGEICVQKVNELARHGMIWMDEYGFLLKPLEPGKLMTKYYLKFNTMKNIMQTPESCALEVALNIICRSEEIAWIQLRRNEKKLLNDINTDKEGRLRFHILSENGKRKKRIQTREEKIFVLANDCLTGDPLCHDLSFNQDMTSICSNGCRIAKCMKEYFIYKKSYKGFLNSTLLAKCLHQRLWDESPYLLKQLTGIGMVTAKALNSAGINSFETLAEADPRRIEILTGRKYPFGNHIKESLLSLPPKVEMKIEEVKCHRQGKSKLVVTLTRITQSVSSAKRHSADMVIGSEEDNLILFHEKISPYSTEILVSTPQQGKLTLKAGLIFEEYIGLDLHDKLFVEKAIDSSMIHRRSNQKSSFTYDLPKEIYVIEDDNENTSFETTTEELHISNDFKKATSSMPSFNLLDDEDMEGVPPTETEEKGCHTITEQTVFDHIRRKAKSFPVLATSNAMDPSTSETLISIRKHSYGKELHRVIEVRDTDDVQRETVLISDSEIGDAEKQSYGTEEDAVSTKSRISGRFIMEASKEDGPIADCKGSSFTAAEETIFSHIRKKAKNFPEFPTSKAMQSEPSLPLRDYFYNEPYNIHHPIEVLRETNSNIQRETTMIPDFEPGEVEHDVFRTKDAKENYNSFDCCSSNITGKPSPYLKVSVPANALTEMKIPSLKTLRAEEDIQLDCKARSPLLSKSPREYGDIRLHSSNGSKRKPCSLDLISEIREVQSFPGFKSIFSFL
ncbi:Atp-dependent dna helicase mer3-like protein [Thalictrum thalictroides]|uniref:DNA 3'-5' helicase n=1 Tax=Thalictrum thalictroides TaxID=46969 RepID=A0A7J6WGI1_THATH|nr:Atp-dependent dna helicase mer3-like protein [Thalictrum thalictroides]